MKPSGVGCPSRLARRIDVIIVSSCSEHWSISDHRITTLWRITGLVAGHFDGRWPKF